MVTSLFLLGVDWVWWWGSLAVYTEQCPIENDVCRHTPRTTFASECREPWRGKAARKSSCICKIDSLPEIQYLLSGLDYANLYRQLWQRSIAKLHESSLLLPDRVLQSRNGRYCRLPRLMEHQYTVWYQLFRLCTLTSACRFGHRISWLPVNKGHVYGSC